LVDLGVDAENMTGALGMYERAGFERDQERWTYALDVSR
jgi:ribosomal protein S18 acetylase RimI-like enzyme